MQKLFSNIYMAGYILLATIGLSQAQAEGLRYSDGNAQDLAAMVTGDQLVLEAFNGPLTFAGNSLHLDNWNGVLGYASEVAYVVTISGTASMGKSVAPAGRMLMVLPYSKTASVQRFDAARLRKAWPTEVTKAAPAAFTALERLGKHQARGIFLGRLAQTSFNVAASGAAKAESGRRSVVGGEAVRSIRFGGEIRPDAVERNIVTRFITALKEGDSRVVAEFIDPVPYGNMDLSGGGDAARQLMAEQMIGQRDWQQQLGDAEARREGQGNNWIVDGPGGRTIITLRPMGDFAFVRNVQSGS